jgi:hypothetical protein
VGYAAGGVTGAASALGDALVDERQTANLVQNSAAQTQYPREPAPIDEGVTPIALPTTTTPSGGLPFTGLGLASTLVASLLLIATGLGLRRASYARAGSRRAERS